MGLGKYKELGDRIVEDMKTLHDALLSEDAEDSTILVFTGVSLVLEERGTLADMVEFSSEVLKRSPHTLAKAKKVATEVVQ